MNSKQITVLLSEQLAKESAYLDDLVFRTAKETGAKRIEGTLEMIYSLERISRIEALIARYQ